MNRKALCGFSFVVFAKIRRKAVSGNFNYFRHIVYPPRHSHFFTAFSGASL